MSERDHAIALANRILERRSYDPDDDLAVLSRQLLRALELEAQVYVPGHLQCDRCNFRLVSSNLNAMDGSVTARNTADICPNDGLPMRRVTYREDLSGAHELWEQQVTRAVAAEAIFSAARGALELAEQFITNGVELGYIRMPTSPDPALETLPAIQAVLHKSTTPPRACA